MSLRIGEKMYVLGILLIALGIGFAILSVVFLIKGIIQLNKLKDKDIKIEFKYSETKKKEDNL
jgi:Na+-transporting methylmalonyl-CoA/oxaloacetate decarboxylase gamma subunit